MAARREERRSGDARDTTSTTVMISNIHVVRTPYGTSKPGVPTTICINLFERQRRKRRGHSDLELLRNPPVRRYLFKL